MKQLIHAEGATGNDCTLCGYAIEGLCLDGDTENVVEPVARKGQRVTCEQCLTIIDYCHKFKGHIQP